MVYSDRAKVQTLSALLNKVYSTTPTALKKGATMYAKEHYLTKIIM